MLKLNNLRTLILESAKINDISKLNNLRTIKLNDVIINDEELQNDIATSGYTKLDLSRYVKKMSASSVVKKDYVLKLTKSLVLNKKKFIMYTDFVNKKELNEITKNLMIKNKVRIDEVFVRDYYVKELLKIGVRAIGVSSDMSGEERGKVFDMLENDKIDGLIFGKLGSEGVNIPRVDSVIMCNGTKSTILFPQRVGRAMRTVRNDLTKTNAFIYELVLNTPMEVKWTNENFLEYEQEGYIKNIMNI